MSRRNVAPGPSRVEIEPIAAEHQDEFLSAVRASRRLHRPWIYGPLTPEAFGYWLHRQATGEFDGSLIRRSDDGALVGACQLSQIIRGNLQGAFIGFAAFRGFEGKGYMHEGVGLVLDRAFGPLGLRRVEANIQPGNHASKTLVSRLGFVKEGYAQRYLKVGGRWRDHEHWAIRRELWTGRQTIRA
jgi:[ribosomal protein S5]-alanine N-acetyltransferase